jgi:glycine oxidase
VTREDWDVIVVGQGIAGTTLAWHLHQAGQRVLTIDNGADGTASKIAAGLITPITGQRMALSWRVGEFLPTARTFYRAIEHHTGARFYHNRTAIRLFASDMEQRCWAERRGDPVFQPYIATPQPVPLLDPAVADASGSGFAMQSAQLDVAAYLAVSRAHLPVVVKTIDWRQDVRLGADSASAGMYSAKLIVACEGYAASQNPYFANVPFIAAKGDTLTVRFQAPLPGDPLHRGIWLAPTALPNVFKAGATYDRNVLDNIPSPSGRADIERQLRAFIRVPYDVIGHCAAVRPIIHVSQAVIGRHPHHPRLAYFNGLGSKGSLLAPWFAGCLTAALVHGSPIPVELDLRRWM